MKNIFILSIIISSLYLQIAVMELATTHSIDHESCDQTFRFIPKKIDWISEEKQKVVRTTLLSLQKSKLLNNDLSNVIAYKLFTLHTQDEYESLKKMCPLYLGNQKIDIEQISLMPFSDRKKLILLANPNFSQQIKGANNKMLLECDYDELIEILPDDMKNNLELKIVPNNCFCSCLPKTIGILMFLGGVGFGIAGAATSNPAAFVIPSVSLLITGPITGIVLQHQVNNNIAINTYDYNKLLPEA